MPKDNFSVAATSALSVVPAQGQVHVVGVCGVAMAQLALTLDSMGYQVSGSDKEFYEPMGGLLKCSRIQLFKGYDAKNIPDKTALVVIGNAVPYENPEVLEAEKRRLPYTLFPKLLYESIIAGKHSIVISGTHGKTTTSAMASYLLEQAGKKPSYFIGGVALDLDLSLRRDDGNVSVVEGDEYDSAFFAKVPKFSFYKPNTLVVTSIEFDHADIYQNLDSILKEFNALVYSMPEGSRVIACADDPEVRKLIPAWKENATATVLSYGSDTHADIKILTLEERQGVQYAKIQPLDHPPFELKIKLSGRYNINNATAVLAAATRVGLSWEQGAALLANFRGVKRRQEIRLANDRVTLIEDFAHHPTAVRETLAGIRARWPQGTIWAVFEPRSNTSRRKIFQNDYVKAFSFASQVILCHVAAKSMDQGEALLDVAELSAAIAASGIPAQALSDPAAIAQHLLTAVGKGDVVVVMSNGSFGGLIDQLLSKWAK